MVDKKYDFLIVGSGTGGATLARELSRKNQSVLVLEKGSREKKLGTFQDSLRFYDANRLTKVPKTSKEGVIIWRTIMAGGSSVVSCGNGTRCLEKEFANFGIKLDEELSEVEKETDVKPFAEELLSEGSKRIMQASKELGYRMELMPKFIQHEKCKNCGKCILQCPSDPKSVNWRNHGDFAYPVYDYTTCIRCYCCQEMCPDEAISIRTPLIGRLLNKINL